MDRPAYPSADLGLSWRPLTPDDVPAWAQLQKAIETADDAPERYEADDLLEELTVGSHKDPSRDSVVGIDADATPRAFGLNDLLPGDSLRRAFLFGGVHPQWRGRGVGRELLRWQRDQSRWAWAQQEHHGAEPLPWRVVTSHPERLVANSALARRLGFEPVRWFHDMVRELTTEGAPPVPEIEVPAPLRLAAWTADLDEAVRLAHNEAFAGHWGSQPRTVEAWQQFGIGHRNTRRDWSFVVVDPTREQGGRPAVAAYTLSNAYTQDWEAQGFTQGWTGLLGVRPPWRGRRLAPALLAAALRAFAAAGMHKAGLDVDTGNASGALRLYEGMGYRVEHTSVMWAVEGSGSAAG